jgi:hypothetical protein
VVIMIIRPGASAPDVPGSRPGAAGEPGLRLPQAEMKLEDMVRKFITRTFRRRR